MTMMRFGFWPMVSYFSGRAAHAPRSRHEARGCFSPPARRQAANGVLRGGRPGNRAQVAPRDRPAVGVGEAEPGDAPSGAPVLDDDRLPTPAEDPLVGPLPERRQHRQQRLALLRQAIFETLPFAAHVHALEDAVIDQMLEPGGEDVLGDTEAALEVDETAGAEEGVADDEQGPPVPEGLEGLPDPAVHVGEALPPHAQSIARGGWWHQATKPVTDDPHERRDRCRGYGGWPETPPGPRRTEGGGRPPA